MVTTKINIKAKTQPRTPKRSAGALPSSQRLCPPISMGRAAVPPTNGKADPYGLAQGAHGWVWRRNGWFACFGRRKETHRAVQDPSPIEIEAVQEPPPSNQLTTTRKRALAVATTAIARCPSPKRRRIIGHSRESRRESSEDRRAEPRVAPREFGRLRRGGGMPAASLRRGGGHGDGDVELSAVRATDS